MAYIREYSPGSFVAEITAAWKLWGQRCGTGQEDFPSNYLLCLEFSILWGTKQLWDHTISEKKKKQLVKSIILESSSQLDLIQSNLYVRPPVVSDHLPKATANPKHQNIPSQSLTVGTASKRPPSVSDRDHFLGLTVYDFPLFSASCKRPCDTFSDLYFCCVHYVT